MEQAKPVFVRVLLALLGTGVTLVSASVISVMLAFWQESSNYPNRFLEFVATWGLWMWVIGFCIAWIFMRLRTPRFTLFDNAIFLLPVMTLWLYLTFQGYV